MKTSKSIDWHNDRIGNMQKLSSDTKPIPPSGLLRWEITFALLIKILFLVGLWWLIFRWQERPIHKPDIATHFALPTALANVSSQAQKEPNHDR